MDSNSPVTATLPFDHVAIDLMQIATTRLGFNFVLILVDICSRMVLLRGLQKKAAVDIAQVLLEIFSNFGVPKILQSDNDPSFLNAVVNELKEKVEYKSREVLKYFPNQNVADMRTQRNTTE